MFPCSERELAANYLVALAARAVHEVGGLVRRAKQHDQDVATLSIDTATAAGVPSAA